MVPEGDAACSGLRERALSEILRSANDDGGWGSRQGETSRVTVTASAVSVLRRADRQAVEPEAERVLRAGIDFLLRSQNADGGWGFRLGEYTNSVATSSALIALSDGLADETCIARGLECLESEARTYGKYDGTMRDLFKREATAREQGIERWSYFVLPLMTYAFLASGRTLEAYRETRRLLEVQQPNGSWTDPDEPYSTFHTFVTLFYLSKIRDRLDMEQFDRYCRMLDLFQKEEYESLLLAKKDRLKRIILEQGLRVSDEEFVLTSGKRSRYYYDLKPVLLDPASISIIGEILWELTKLDRVNTIGGPESGSIPIATAVVSRSYGSGRPLKAFFVRKEPKKHGTQQWIEGSLNRGDRAIVVDDVVTTGGSLLDTVQKLKEINCEVSRVICIVDREEGAKERFERLGITLDSIFTHADFGAVI